MSKVLLAVRALELALEVLGRAQISIARFQELRAENDGDPLTEEQVTTLLDEAQEAINKL